MKKNNSIFFLVVGILGFTALFSCTPEENDDVSPSMIFSSEGLAIDNSTTVSPGSSLLFEISCTENPTTKRNLSNLRIQSFTNNSPNLDTTVEINASNFLGIFEFTATSDYSTEEKFDFTLLDAAGESATKSITITTEDAGINETPFNSEIMDAFFHIGGSTGFL